MYYFVCEGLSRIYGRAGARDPAVAETVAILKAFFQQCWLIPLLRGITVAAVATVMNCHIPPGKGCHGCKT